MFLKLCYRVLCITPEDHPSLKRDTTEDRVNLNYSIAGKNNNKNCTITMLGELCTSESMTQVCAFLHTFMHENTEALTGLSKRIP